MGLPLNSVSGSQSSHPGGARVDLKPYTVSIARGDGLVARFGDVVMYIADANAFADRLLAVGESVAETDRPGAVIAGRLATVVFGPESHRITPFGVVTTSADGLHVILRGPVTAQIDGTDGAQTLSGARALTWVDEILTGSVHTIAVTTSGAPRLSGCPQTDLRDGVVPAGGFVLHHCSDEVLTTRSKLHCARNGSGRPVEPTERMTCHPAKLGWRPRRSAASARYLESADGAVYPLDRPYVIGRYPLGDDAVRNATASPIVVHNDNQISRVHAYVSIDHGAVTSATRSRPVGRSSRHRERRTGPGSARRQPNSRRNGACGSVNKS